MVCRPLMKRAKSFEERLGEEAQRLHTAAAKAQRGGRAREILLRNARQADVAFRSING
jgi:hypothetical protein